jgi:hypothetical protein
MHTHKGKSKMKIDKNISLEAKQTGKPGCSSYVWDKMVVGDSVFYDDEKKGSASNPAMAARGWGKTNNARFAARKQKNGVRIWRVA